MRAREWKRLIEEERDRMRQEGHEKIADAERYAKAAGAQARLLWDSADALDRVLKAAESDPAEDPEPGPDEPF